MSEEEKKEMIELITPQKTDKDYEEEIERLKEELEFEKATNKELLSTGAELENKLYEEQDKNKRLNNIIKEVREYIEEWQKFPHTNGSTHKELKNLIDILDKGE